MTGSVRISIDIPRDLHRQLNEVAARKGCSAGEFIVATIQRTVQETEPTGSRRLKLDPPLIAPAGRRIHLTNEQVYDLLEFP